MSETKRLRDKEKIIVYIEETRVYTYVYTKRQGLALNGLYGCGTLADRGKRFVVAYCGREV